MGITILDIAKAAGVSKSTVSLVINGSNLVKQETRHKVLQTIERLGYVPNMAARALTTSKKRTFGLIFLTSSRDSLPHAFDSVTDTLLLDVSYGIHSGLKNTDYNLLIERFSTDGEEKLPDIVRNKRVDGIFLIGGLFNHEFIELLKQQNIAVVLIGRKHGGIDSVSVDSRQVGYLGAQYLLEQGHRNIVFVNGPADSAISQEKLEGFQAAVQDSGRENVKTSVLNTSYTGLGGYEAMTKLWRRGIRPDGVFGGSDGITMGIMRFLYREGVRIPQDISIVGYEESILTAHAPVQLTVIDGHKQQLGESACLGMLERMLKPAAPELSLVLEPVLIKRESVRNRNGC